MWGKSKLEAISVGQPSNTYTCISSLHLIFDPISLISPGGILVLNLLAFFPLLVSEPVS